MLGYQYIVELQNCNQNKIDDIKTIEDSLRKIAIATNSDVLTSSFHKFSPQGATVILIVRNSHLSFHSWPEHGFASVDIFVCNGLIDIKNCTQILKEDFECTEISVLLINRGVQF